MSPSTAKRFVIGSRTKDDKLAIASLCLYFLGALTCRELDRQGNENINEVYDIAYSSGLKIAH